MLRAFHLVMHAHSASRSAASAPAEARNQPRVLLPRSAAIASNPPSTCRGTRSTAAGVARSASAGPDHPTAGSRAGGRRETRCPRQVGCCPLPAPALIVMDSEPRRWSVEREPKPRCRHCCTPGISPRDPHCGAIRASSQRVEGLGGYAGSGSRGVLGSLSTKVRT